MPRGWGVKAGMVRLWVAGKKRCDPLVTHGPYLSALEIRSYINSPSLLYFNGLICGDVPLRNYSLTHALTYSLTHSLFTQWRDFNETCHTYLACEWELLKRCSRSEVKGQGHIVQCVNAITTEAYILTV